MFTWNFQFVSKARLAETFNQLMLGAQKGDILIRIHTAIHLKEEAVDLARYIKSLVPGAHIFGTSTSAVINRGKLVQDQCIISVTQMNEVRVKTALFSTFNTDGEPLPADTLCETIKTALIDADTKLLLTFLTPKYRDVFRFIDRCNDYFPLVQMTGGIANLPDNNLIDAGGFVFNEDGWSEQGIILAALGGEKLECVSSYAAGVQAIGDESEVTDAFGTCILSIDGKDAAGEYRSGIGAALEKKPELTNLFPYVYADTNDVPIFVEFWPERSLGDAFPENEPINADAYETHPDIDRTRERVMIIAPYNVEVGRKLRRAFIYDGKVISDNRNLFRRIENFEKAETIFGYSCITRSQIYSNCAKWELSAYENSNMCGCITRGEIAYTGSRNTLANCTFVVSVMGEEKASPRFNPYVFSYTDALAADNRELLSYLMDIESGLEQDQRRSAANKLKSFVHDCELKLLYVGSEDIPNAAALNMDVKLKGYDRICMINVADISSMKAVFPEQMIRLTHKNFVEKCVGYAHRKQYRVYLLDSWRIAVAAPSYMVKLSGFVSDMEELQKELFQNSEDYIAIVPVFCVLDACTAENMEDTYSAAKVEMAQKNIQFYVRDARTGELDEDSIRERYHMVNVINYALTHDAVLPYYQGIYDNQQGKIHHYESLMRLKDENGRIYFPGEFLDVARSFGLLYDSLSKAMIRKVFQKFKTVSDKSVSINLGLRDIKNRELVEYIYTFLAGAEHPGNFVFEILENEDIDDYEYLIGFVDKIHSLGGRISIDDFGSGYSNLQHVSSIHSDYLKIDGSIVKRCCDDQESDSLIALISQWRTLSGRKVEIIAEYVENEAIQTKMKNYGIEFSQGYLFSRPSPDIRDN